MNERAPHEQPDRELSLRGIVFTGIGLALILVVSAALMWPLAARFRDAAKAADPPPPVLLEAREPQPPPEPRLQTDPAGDMVRLRAEEDALLGGYAWIDEAGGIARIPVERAMELLLEEPPAGDGPATSEAGEVPSGASAGGETGSEQETPESPASAEGNAP